MAGTDVPAAVESLPTGQSAQGEQSSSEEQRQPIASPDTTRLESEIRFLQRNVEELELAQIRLKQRFVRLLIVILLLSGFALFWIIQSENRTATQMTALKTALDALHINSVSHAPLSNGAPVTFYQWKQGDPPVRLIKYNEGICFLTGVSGHFLGGGEQVRLWIGSDGFWYLGGQSQQQGVSAECAVVRY